MAAELGLNPKTARRAGLLHDIGKVPDDEPELPHAIMGMKLAEKYKEKPEVGNAIGAHHDEIEMTSLIAPIIQVCDAISGARPGARREMVESIYQASEGDGGHRALVSRRRSRPIRHPGGPRAARHRRCRQALGPWSPKSLSPDIAKKIQDEMTYPVRSRLRSSAKPDPWHTQNRIFIQIPPSGFYNQSPFPLSWKGLFLRNT